MYLTTYVGPYFKVSDLPSSIEERHQNIVSDGRGELYSDDPDDVTYLVPNCKLPGVTRQMRFSRDTDMPVIEITAEDRVLEMMALSELACVFVRDVNDLSLQIQLHWGVVCEYR